VPAVVTKVRVRKVRMRTLVTAAGTHDTCSTCKAEQVKIQATCLQYMVVSTFLLCLEGKTACHAALWQQQ